VSERVLSMAEHKRLARIAVEAWDGRSGTGLAALLAEKTDAHYWRHVARLGGSGNVLQSWVGELGLRHQGVLLTAVRGCDTAPKGDASKNLVRVYRSAILNCHCGNPNQAKTFIEAVSDDEAGKRFLAFRKNLDHYPHHYIAHLMHAFEIVGYKHPEMLAAARWRGYYEALCRGLHINPETVEQLDARLNADEAAFAAMDRA
jgi:hypothetical protein